MIKIEINDMITSDMIPVKTDNVIFTQLTIQLTFARARLTSQPDPADRANAATVHTKQPRRSNFAFIVTSFGDMINWIILKAIIQ